MPQLRWRFTISMHGLIIHLNTVDVDVITEAYSILNAFSAHAVERTFWTPAEVLDTWFNDTV